MKKKFMLVMRGSSENFASLEDSEQKRIIDSYQSFAGSLAQSGYLVDGDSFQPGTTLLQSSEEKVEVIQNPRAGSTEALSGYFIVNTDSREQAVELARKCPCLTHGESVEVVPMGF